MLAVIAIIGILIAIIVPNVVSVITRAEDEVVKVQAESVKNAILSYYLDQSGATSLEDFLDDNVFTINNEFRKGLFPELQPYLDGFGDDRSLDDILTDEGMDYILESFGRK
ncbi:typeII_sec_gspG: type II secretion system protein G [Natranaerofaba carboxydovora]|nr:typeII_sec_gspG: type II secretion system protein G [Natranaerofaba carboxydovora]